jgi:septum formation protein
LNISIVNQDFMRGNAGSGSLFRTLKPVIPGLIPGHGLDDLRGGIQCRAMANAPALILASRSPRRAQLLRAAGYDFQVVASPFDDPPQPQHSDDPHALAIDLARQKAQALAAAWPLERPGAGASCVLLGADTLCVGADGSILGTPGTPQQARAMLHAFAGRTHQVITGVALIVVRGDGFEEAAAFADEVAVTWGAVSADQIQAYLDTEQWRGKAGGYNLFDRLDAGWPITLSHSSSGANGGQPRRDHWQGPDPTTVVGLPMRRVTVALRELGVVPKSSCFSGISAGESRAEALGLGVSGGGSGGGGGGSE